MWRGHKRNLWAKSSPVQTRQHSRKTSWKRCSFEMSLGNQKLGESEAGEKSRKFLEREGAQQKPLCFQAWSRIYCIDLEACGSWRDPGETAWQPGSRAEGWATGCLWIKWVDREPVMGDKRE